VGTVLLAYGWDHWGLYDLLVAPARPVSLLNEFGMAVALVLTLAGLGAWYLFATWWETRPAALPRSRPAPIRAPRTELREPAS